MENHNFSKYPCYVQEELWDKICNTIINQKLTLAVPIDGCDYVKPSLNCPVENFYKKDVIAKLVQKMYKHMLEIQKMIKLYLEQEKRKNFNWLYARETMRKIKFIANQIHEERMYETVKCGFFFKFTSVAFNEFFASAAAKFEKRYLTRTEFVELLPENMKSSAVVIFKNIDVSSVGFITLFPLKCFFCLYDSFQGFLDTAAQPYFQGHAEDIATITWLEKTGRKFALAVCESKPYFFKIYLRNGKQVTKHVVYRNDHGYYVSERQPSFQSIQQLLQSQNFFN